MQSHAGVQTIRAFRYYDVIMVAFVTLILCSNLIGASKVCTLFGVSFGGSLFFFPLSYLFGDILTEVYGYQRSRKVVWAGFAAMIFASFVSWFVVSLPPAQGWPNQTALETIFSQTPRIVIGSLAAYFFGEFSNSYVLAKMKILTQGKWLWTRFLGSTVVGEAIDTAIFYPLAFLGAWSPDLLLKVMLTSYCFKVLWEVVMIPFTYRLVSYLKEVENEDYFDHNTRFSPFSLS